MLETRHNSGGKLKTLESSHNSEVRDRVRRQTRTWVRGSLVNSQTESFPSVLRGFHGPSLGPRTDLGSGSGLIRRSSSSDLLP